jgi:hypothetical protein
MDELQNAIRESQKQLMQELNNKTAAEHLVKQVNEELAGALIAKNAAERADKDVRQGLAIERERAKRAAAERAKRAEAKRAKRAEAERAERAEAERAERAAAEIANQPKEKPLSWEPSHNVIGAHGLGGGLAAPGPHGTAAGAAGQERLSVEQPDRR